MFELSIFHENRTGRIDEVAIESQLKAEMDMRLSCSMLINNMRCGSRVYARNIERLLLFTLCDDGI